MWRLRYKRGSLMLTPKDYQNALAVQDACNLSGVVLAFMGALDKIREEVKDTDKINKHPISVMYADKIAHLTGTQFNSFVISEAYEVCNEKAKS